MKKMFISLITLPIMIVISIMECILKLSVKLSTVVVGLFYNILLICTVIAVCTKQWESVGILVLVAVIGLILVYGNATLLYLMGEAKSYISKLKGV